MVVVSFLTPLVAPRPPEVQLHLPLDQNDVVDAVEMGGCIGEKSRELPLVPDSSGDKDERVSRPVLHRPDLYEGSGGQEFA